MDSSALVKLLVPEPGAELVENLLAEADERYASLLGYAELRSAVAAAARDRRLDGAATLVTRQQLDSLWSKLAAVAVDEQLVRDAADLSDRHGLRAGDAIHLASALRIADGPTTFIAFDGRLREAATAEGLIVMPEAA